MRRIGASIAIGLLLAIAGLWAGLASRWRVGLTDAELAQLIASYHSLTGRPAAGVTIVEKQRQGDTYCRTMEDRCRYYVVAALLNLPDGETVKVDNWPVWAAYRDGWAAVNTRVVRGGTFYEPAQVKPPLTEKPPE